MSRFLAWLRSATAGPRGERMQGADVRETLALGHAQGHACGNETLRNAAGHHMLP